MKLSITLLSLLIFTACSADRHPLEESPKFKLPQVVKPEDMVATSAPATQNMRANQPLAVEQADIPMQFIEE